MRTPRFAPALLAALLLAGCTAAPAGSGDAAASAEAAPASESAETPEPPAENAGSAQPLRPLLEGDEKQYYMVEMVTGELIRYRVADLTAHETAVPCTVEGCAHDTEDCPAVFRRGECDKVFVLDEDTLVAFTNNNFPETEDSQVVLLDRDCQNRRVVATNVYDRDQADELTVTKVFKGLSDEDVARLTSFKLTVTGPDDFTTTTLIADSNSKVEGTKYPTYTWTLENVPTGEYTVTENRKDVKLAEYSMTVKSSVNNGALGVLKADENNDFTKTVELEKGDETAITVQNAYTRQTGDLTITKTVVGDEDDEGKLPDGAADTQVYTFTIVGPADADGVYSGTDFVKGKATVTITGDDEMTIEDLPTGTYTIVENTENAEVIYWNLDVTTQVGDAEPAEGSTAEAAVVNNGTTEVTVTNTYTREVPPVEPPEDLLTTLTIRKVVKDSRGGDLSALAADKEYHFQITGKDVYDDAPLTQKVTITGATSRV